MVRPSPPAHPRRPSSSADTAAQHLRSAPPPLPPAPPASPREHAIKRAIQSGDTAAVARLLAQPGVLVDSVFPGTDDKGRTLLMFACTSPAATADRMVELLLAAGASINQRTRKSGGTALMYAALWCEVHLGPVHRLLGAGAEVDALNDEGKSALGLVAAVGCAAGARLLLAAGASVRPAGPTRVSPLMIAAQFGHLETLRVLLEHGGGQANAQDASGVSSLMLGAQYQHFDVVRELLVHGANVSQVDRVGMTALIAACWGGSGAIVEALLRSGADVNAATRNGITPLLTAVMNEHANVVRLLLRAGARQKQGGEARGETELMLASEACLPSILDLLIRYSDREALGATGSSGLPALALAGRNGCDAAVNLLLAAGASHDAGSALAWAVRAGRASSARAMLAAGAPTSFFLEGMRPLQWAVVTHQPALFIAIMRVECPFALPLLLIALVAVIHTVTRRVNAPRAVFDAFVHASAAAGWARSLPPLAAVRLATKSKTTTTSGSSLHPRKSSAKEKARRRGGGGGGDSGGGSGGGGHGSAPVSASSVATEESDGDLETLWHTQHARTLTSRSGADAQPAASGAAVADTASRVLPRKLPSLLQQSPPQQPSEAPAPHLLIALTPASAEEEMQHIEAALAASVAPAAKRSGVESGRREDGGPSCAHAVAARAHVPSAADGALAAAAPSCEGVASGDSGDTASERCAVALRERELAERAAAKASAPETARLDSVKKMVRRRYAPPQQAPPQQAPPQQAPQAQLNPNAKPWTPLEGRAERGAGHCTPPGVHSTGAVSWS